MSKYYKAKEIFQLSDIGVVFQADNCVWFGRN